MWILEPRRHGPRARRHPANTTTVAAATTTVPTTTIPTTTIPTTTIPIAPTVERPSQLVDEIASRSATAGCTSAASGAARGPSCSSAGWDDGGDKWGAIEPTISEHDGVYVVCTVRHRDERPAALGADVRHSGR